MTHEALITAVAAAQARDTRAGEAVAAAQSEHRDATHALSNAWTNLRDFQDRAVAEAMQDIG